MILMDWFFWMVKVIVWNVKRRVLNLKRATSHGLCIFVSYQSTDDSYDVLSTVMLNSFNFNDLWIQADLWIGKPGNPS